jgi:hypothetical protein
MTVKEYIEQLQTLDQDAFILTGVRYEYSCAIIPEAQFIYGKKCYLIGD